MNKAEHHDLNLFEMHDRISLGALNHNTNLLDTLLKSAEDKIGKRVCMACGSYEGTGELSASIETPGFTAAALLIREESGFDGYDYNNIIWGTSGGFHLWVGSDLACTYRVGYKEYNSDTDEAESKTTEMDTTVVFAPGDGTIAWSVETPVPEASDIGKGIIHTITVANQPGLVNNIAGRTYQWIAFGYAPGGDS